MHRNWLLLPFLLCLNDALTLNPSFARTIALGNVFSIDGWIPCSEVAKLREFCSQLKEEGHFEASGLSYAETPQILESSADRLVCDEIPEKYINDEIFSRLDDRIDALRIEVSSALCRNSMMRSDLPHESYFSLSLPGADLKRHMDEKHEELKPSRRWALETRRSISWLLYLNVDSWDASLNGGQLRSFPQNSPMYPSFFGSCGCHEGNLQIGWLEAESYVKPVYMQSWSINQKNLFQFDTSDIDDRNIQTEGNEVLSSLYVLSVFKRKVYLTGKFVANEGTSLSSQKKNQIKSKSNFQDKCLHNMKSNILKNGKHKFSLIENYALWTADNNDQNECRSRAPLGTIPSELLPRGGTLCMFDSASLPHEVLHTLHGERLAIAGWFHEVVSPMESVSEDDHEYLAFIDSYRDAHDRTALLDSVFDEPKSDKLILSAMKAMAYKYRFSS
jgi:hypothetical protein